MHILITVFFNAHHGGLHDNIFSTIKQSIKLGNHITVVCKSGMFEERLKKIGVQVVTTDFHSNDNTTNDVINAPKNDYDVIHAHPGPSREVALQVSEKLELPIVMTFHGMWADSVVEYSDKLSAIFPVSEGVKDFLKRTLIDDFDKMMIMPNGVNKKLFKPKNKLFKRKDEVLNISLITRLDKDKDFIIQVFYKALEYTSNHFLTKVRWTIVGDGTELDSMKKTVKDITKGQQKVAFIGWKAGKELLKNYQESDIVIAPGRCALEAMACGKPVIAIGSKKYNGLVTKDNWTRGVYTNFGGFGNKMNDYIDGTIEAELEQVISSQKLREELGSLGVFITDQFYNEDQINNKIIGVYNIIKN
ncbi:glycosyltransferase family 4 protein [Alkalihalophilus marmarensis]|uniref:glycosyltransferase family 4 protein n=1 Tax=Alkalihalophilus marmarensis TaxID=521377 RepID=UPI002E211B31|nr:glycosyltransferase family 4 protein [Alkalihalophilus marmarensis]